MLWCTMGDDPRYQRLSRIVDLVKFIQNNESVTANDIAKSLSVSEQSVYQDLRELNAVGIPIYFSQTGYRILPSFKPSQQNFNVEESVILSLGLALLKKNGLVDGKKVQEIQTKIASPTIEPSSIEKITDSARTSAPLVNIVDPDVMSFLNKAILARLCIKMKYRSRKNASPTWRELSPYTVVYRKETWYTIGYCHRREEIRTFKVSRIEDTTESQEAFFTDKDFDIDRYLMHNWYIMGGEPNVVVIRFDKEIAPLILEKKATHGQVWKEGDSVYLQTAVSGLNEISWWIMQYGEHAEVLQPRELRRLLAKRCAKMTAMYSTSLRNRSGRVKKCRNTSR